MADEGRVDPWIRPALAHVPECGNLIRRFGGATKV